jgi:hypothetical protein
MSSLEDMGITLSSWITERKNYHDLDSVTHVYMCGIGNTILAMDRPLKEHALVYCVCCGRQGFTLVSD